MKTRSILMVTGLFAIIGLSAFKFANTDVPKGWIKAGSDPKAYEFGTTTDASRNGKVGYMKSTEKKIAGFGTLMQNIYPKSFLGKRVRMTAYIRTENVVDWCGMWMRVDGEKKAEMLGFDNMEKRAIKGTTPWTKYEIVLDVPSNAIGLAYGVLTVGTGDAYIDDINFEIVDLSVPTTNTLGKDNVYSTEPINTNFEESDK